MEQTFELKSFKLAEFGVDCKYKLAETDDDGVVAENDYHVKVSRPIHRDLEQLFSVDLVQILADIFGAEDNEAIVPNGISFAGKNDNVGVAISGDLKTKIGKVSFKTKRVKYLTGTSDFAAKLTVFADKIVDEVHAYLFENKTAEMAVFGE